MLLPRQPEARLLGAARLCRAVFGVCQTAGARLAGEGRLHLPGPGSNTFPPEAAGEGPLQDTRAERGAAQRYKSAVSAKREPIRPAGLPPPPPALLPCVRTPPRRLLLRADREVLLDLAALAHALVVFKELLLNRSLRAALGQCQMSVPIDPSVISAALTQPLRAFTADAHLNSPLLMPDAL